MQMTQYSHQLSFVSWCFAHIAPQTLRFIGTPLRGIQGEGASPIEEETGMKE